MVPWAKAVESGRLKVASSSASAVILMVVFIKFRVRDYLTHSVSRRKATTLVSESLAASAFHSM